MARYVMLEFADDQMAEDFAKAVHENAGVIYPKSTKAGEDKWENKFLPLVAVVRGLWFKPSRFCECNLATTSEKFVKGSKYGIFVHVTCKKPRPGHTQWPKNLLDPSYVLGRAPKLWLNTREPLDSPPSTTAGGKEQPNLAFQVTEPTPKAELDRVAANLDSLS